MRWAIAGVCAVIIVVAICAMFVAPPGETVITPLPTAVEPTLAPAQPIKPDEEDLPPIVKPPFDGITIGIDPGHQAKGNNQQEPIAPGSSETKAKVASGTQGIGTKIPEHVINLEVSLKLRDALTALGVRVVLTRDTADVDISNIERAQMMNDENVGACLRIHCNGAESKSVNGMSIYATKTGPIATDSASLARCLLDQMVSYTGAKSLGVIQNDTYTGLNWSSVPSVLVEMGFMTNPDEDQKLCDAAYQDRIVAGCVAGLADYFGIDLSTYEEDIWDEA